MLTLGGVELVSQALELLVRLLHPVVDVAKCVGRPITVAACPVERLLRGGGVLAGALEPFVVLVGFAALGVLITALRFRVVAG